MVLVPEVVRNKALACGASDWLVALPDLVAAIEEEWSLAVGRPYQDATEAFVAAARLEDGTFASLKLVMPTSGDAARNEATALRLAGGDGCVRLLREDLSRGALLLEQLGPSLAELHRPIEERRRIMASVAWRVWRPAAGCGLPNGMEKAARLVEMITASWEECGYPCSERTIDHAVACAERRMNAYDEERAVLVHGDVQQWNTLVAPDGFKLVDPDGLLAEAEYDMGVIMREDPLELLDGEPFDRARSLAAYCDGELDPMAILEWGVVERISTGLLLTRIDLQPFGRHMLLVADRLAA
jgi:streptomycin 6-kinase